MNKIFYGRQKELSFLQEFLRKKTASLLVIEGRRRIGKSRLIEEFAHKNKKPFYTFTGLAPDRFLDAQIQRNEFSRKLSEYFQVPQFKAEDWGDLFSYLARQTSKGSNIIFFDEISWMAANDVSFLAKLKNAWDTEFKKNSNLILILCGSISSWIEQNILSSTGFVGRISHVLNLEELPLKDCNYFWHNEHHISTYEKLKFLSISGGVPLYLEIMDPGLSAEQNIQRLCFTKGGLLVREFNNIFSDLFSSRSSSYKKIVSTLANGAKDTKAICQALDIQATGWISQYLDDLCKSGFISRDYTWNINTGGDSKLSQYRLKDNYLRFYLKYIEKNQSKIDRNNLSIQSLSALPNWNSIQSLQFENLVLNNRPTIKSILNISPEEVISDNPFFQRKNTKQAGCQIDYLVQTRFHTLYICEIKFSRSLIKANIIDEVEEKIQRLKRPKSYSCRPILIHANGVSQDVIESQYFNQIIDFSELLDG